MIIVKKKKKKKKLKRKRKRKRKEKDKEVKDDTIQETYGGNQVNILLCTNNV